MSTTASTINGAEFPAGPSLDAGGFRNAQINKSKAKRATEYLHQQLDLVGAILTVVVAGAVAYAGLNVMSSIEGTMSLANNSTFSSASDSLTDGISTFFQQMPTVFIVIALVLVIGYLTILRR